MDNESEVIRQQMENTRTDLQEKLETLEQQVKDTVQGATEAANETVQTVKDAVQETVETVKDTVQETVASVKQTLDVRLQIENHPWPMFFAATAAGYMVGRLLGQPEPPRTVMATSSLRETASTRPPSGTKHNGKHAAKGERSGLFAGLAEYYSDELKKLQGIAIGAAAAVARDMLINAVPPAMAEQINEIVDSVTTKLGAKPMHGEMFRPSPSTGGSGTSQEDRFESRGARSMGTN
jgi:ElaB/YqjD/DUF883 family membrane-anchored ribosome-binding protein